MDGTKGRSTKEWTTGLVARRAYIRISAQAIDTKAVKKKEQPEVIRNRVSQWVEKEGQVKGEYRLNGRTRSGHDECVLATMNVFSLYLPNRPSFLFLFGVGLLSRFVLHWARACASCRVARPHVERCGARFLARAFDPVSFFFIFLRDFARAHGG